MFTLAVRLTLFRGASPCPGDTLNDIDHRKGCVVVVVVGAVVVVVVVGAVVVVVVLDTVVVVVAGGTVVVVVPGVVVVVVVGTVVVVVPGTGLGQPQRGGCHFSVLSQVSQPSTFTLL